MRALPAAAARVRRAMKRAAALLGAARRWRGAEAARRRGRAPRRDDAARRAGATVRDGDPVVHLRALQRIADRSDGNRAAGTAGRASGRPTTSSGRCAPRAGGCARRTVRFPFFEQRSPPRLGGLRPGREVRAAEYSGSGAAARARCGASTAPGAPMPRLRGRPARATSRWSTAARALPHQGAQRRSAPARARSSSSTSTGRRRCRRRCPARASASPSSSSPATPRRGARGRATVSVRVDAVSERRDDANVIAETRPAASGRWSMAGAHLDSVERGPGHQRQRQRRRGAAGDRRAAARPARACGSASGRPRSSALYGSRHYVRSLSGEERRRDRGLRQPRHGRLAERRASNVYDRDDRDRAGAAPRRSAATRARRSSSGASDHAPFERAGIPVGGLFTGASERGGARARPTPATTAPATPCATSTCRSLRRMTDAAERGLSALASA